MNSNEDPLASNPFSYVQTKNGLVRIYALKKLAKTLKGRNADRFLAKVAGCQEREKQLVMAKVTGQFKFGNERPNGLD